MSLYFNLILVALWSLYRLIRRTGQETIISQSTACHLPGNLPGVATPERKTSVRPWGWAATICP